MSHHKAERSTKGKTLPKNAGRAGRKVGATGQGAGSSRSTGLGREGAWDAQGPTGHARNRLQARQGRGCRVWDAGRASSAWDSPLSLHPAEAHSVPAAGGRGLPLTSNPSGLRLNRWVSPGTLGFHSSPLGQCLSGAFLLQCPPGTSPLITGSAFLHDSHIPPTPLLDHRLCLLSTRPPTFPGPSL